MRLLLHGGHVLDGTGAPPFRGDVLIEDGRIAAVHPAGSSTPPPNDISSETERIDVTGWTLAPGFIDIHTHDDLVFTLPAEQQRRCLAGKVSQGVTTEIVGNCGLGWFPCTPAAAPIVEAVTAFLTPTEARRPGYTIAEYLDAVEHQGPLINVGTLAPHGPIRFSATHAMAPISEPELNTACRMLEQALDEGAWGLSLGLIYPPGLLASTDELIALARCVARHGRIAAFHQRSGSPELLAESIGEILTVGRESGAHVHLSHEHVQGLRIDGAAERLLTWAETARRDGIHYTQDVIPYTTVQTTLLAVYPPWSLADGVAGWLRHAADPETRRRMRLDIETTLPRWPPWHDGNWPTNIVRDVGYERIHIADCPAVPNAVGCSLTEWARQMSTTPYDAMTDLLIRAEGRVTMMLDGINGTRDDDAPLRMLLADPHRAVVGDAWDMGRGRPHPGAWGAFGRLFSRFVHQNLMDAAQAIRRITSLPADILGLTDRGRIRPGAWADLVVFDPERFVDTSNQDTPRSPCRGLDRVFVNGRQVWHAGTFTDAVAGRVIRPGG